MLQLGQLVVELSRQVLANLAQLLFDDVVIVDDPFRGRGNAFAVVHRVGDRPIGRRDEATIAFEPFDESAVRKPPSENAVPRRDLLSVRGQVLETEWRSTERRIDL